MEGTEYPIEHFKLMTNITISLAEQPIQLLEHNYSSQSFGSWWFTFRHSGYNFRVVFDGRDSLLLIQQLVQKEFKNLSSTQCNNLSSNEICKLILGCIKPT